MRRIYGLEAEGVIDSVFERFYAITVERRISHPVVAAICECARNKLFAGAQRKR